MLLQFEFYNLNCYHRPRRIISETDQQQDKQIISNQEALKENVLCLPVKKMNTMLAQVCKCAKMHTQRFSTFHYFIICKCRTQGIFDFGWLVMLSWALNEMSSLLTLYKRKHSGCGNQNSDWITTIERFSPTKPCIWARVQTQSPWNGEKFGSPRGIACYTAKIVYYKPPSRLLCGKS